MSTVRQVIRPTEASRLLGISLSTFWRRARIDPTFPKPFRLGGARSRTTVVDAEELSQWLTACKDAEPSSKLLTRQRAK